MPEAAFFKSLVKKELEASNLVRAYWLKVLADALGILEEVESVIAERKDGKFIQHISNRAIEKILRKKGFSNEQIDFVKEQIKIHEEVSSGDSDAVRAQLEYIDKKKITDFESMVVKEHDLVKKYTYEGRKVDISDLRKPVRDLLFVDSFYRKIGAENILLKDLEQDFLYFMEVLTKAIDKGDLKAIALFELIVQETQYSEYLNRAISVLAERLEILNTFAGRRRAYRIIRNMKVKKIGERLMIAVNNLVPVFKEIVENPKDSLLLGAVLMFLKNAAEYDDKSMVKKYIEPIVREFKPALMRFILFSEGEGEILATIETAACRFLYEYAFEDICEDDVKNLLNKLTNEQGEFSHINRFAYQIIGKYLRTDRRYKVVNLAADGDIAVSQRNLLTQILAIGITWPERIAFEDLAKIIYNLNTPDGRPLAVIIYSRSDYNKGFDNDDHKRYLHSLVDKGYRVIFRESSSLEEAVENVLYATEKQAADLIILAGHGTMKSLRFSEGEGGTLHIKDKEKLLRIRHSLKRGGAVITISCKNGEGGVGADNIANMLRFIFPQAGHIFTCREAENIESLKYNNDGYVVDVVYFGASYDAAALHRYELGALTPLTVLSPFRFNSIILSPGENQLQFKESPKEKDNSGPVSTFPAGSGSFYSLLR
ncbi:MAG: hypothetical protein JSV34_06860, partial [Candidatus Omnitrophota bacterium]